VSSSACCPPHAADPARTQYYNRWANHEQSAKLALELYAKTEQKMEAMQVASALTWIEVQFMRKAVDEVNRCRATLKWTYAMAFYLAAGNEKELFEDNQRDLERAVEELSELLEGPIELEQIAGLRQKVTDKAVRARAREADAVQLTPAGRCTCRSGTRSCSRTPRTGSSRAAGRGTCPWRASEPGVVAVVRLHTCCTFVMTTLSSCCRPGCCCGCDAMRISL
jgi:hypothetical protein